VITSSHFDRPAIERFVQAWQDAFDRGQFDAMAASYSDDAVLSGTGIATLNGRAAIARFWRAACEGAKCAGVRRTVHTDQYDSCGDLGYIQGTVVLTANDTTTVVWYVTVWKRFGERSWRIVADTSTSVAQMQDPTAVAARGHHA
jgi:ketosteroid isomerase-like protein